ncbi:hypothetical protein B3286c1_0070 [Brucella vulpis]|nr:hypothetical protein BF3285c1_0072 [Brucella vulpis]CUW48909.1 hypothetical protein B3286c1_0070 [Brucella vulpis]
MKKAASAAFRLLTNLGQGQNGLRFTERHRFKT